MCGYQGQRERGIPAGGDERRRFRLFLLQRNLLQRLLRRIDAAGHGACRDHPAVQYACIKRHANRRIYPSGTKKSFREGNRQKGKQRASKKACPFFLWSIAVMLKVSPGR